MARADGGVDAVRAAGDAELVAQRGGQLLAGALLLVGAQPGDELVQLVVAVGADRQTLADVGALPRRHGQGELERAARGLLVRRRPSSAPPARPPNPERAPGPGSRGARCGRLATPAPGRPADGPPGRGPPRRSASR